MNKLFSFIIYIAAIIFAFKYNVFLGIGVLILLFGTLIYIKYPEIMVARGNAELNNKNYDLAIAYFEKAYNLKRRKFDIDIAYAQALLRTGNPEKALKIVNEILSISNVRPEFKRLAKQTRVLSSYKLGKVDEAYEEALEMFEDGYTTSNMYCLVGLLMIEKNGITDETIAFCEKAYDYDDDNRDNVDNLLVCYINSGNLEKAKELADDITERFSDFVDGWYHAAQVYYKLGDLSRALECIENSKKGARTFLTTVSEDEIEILKNKIG